MSDSPTDMFSRTLAAALLGLATLAGLMLVWGAFFYRGYGEEPVAGFVSGGFIVASWIASIFIAMAGANRLRASEWVAGGVAVALGIPVIIVMTLAIGLAACDGRWGSHSCLFG